MTRSPAMWLPRGVLGALAAEAERAAPFETGGVLLGYVSEADEPVVTATVGPGPNAVHERHRFVPDHEYQLAEIERLYHESGRLLEYLGDWHTHPGGAAELSRTDLAALRSIAVEKRARVPAPMMLILSPGPLWEAHAWKARLVAHRFRLRRILETRPLVVHVFDAPEPSGATQ